MEHILQKSEPKVGSDLAHPIRDVEIGLYLIFGNY